MATAKTTTTKKATTAKKTTAAKKTTTTKKTTAAKKPAAKKTTTKRTTTSTGSSMKVSAAEKKLVELYRKADADTKKAAVALLKGQKASEGILDSILNNKDLMKTVNSLLKVKK